MYYYWLKFIEKSSPLRFREKVLLHQQRFVNRTCSVCKREGIQQAYIVCFFNRGTGELLCFYPTPWTANQIKTLSNTRERKRSHLREECQSYIYKGTLIIFFFIVTLTFIDTFFNRAVFWCQQGTRWEGIQFISFVVSNVLCKQRNHSLVEIIC